MTPPQNPESELQLDVSQAASGGIFPVRISAPAPCPSCSASAHPGSKSKMCSRCKGQMSLRMETANLVPDGPGTSGFAGECNICRGAGWTVESDCDECHGSALTTATRAIRVRIPAGVTDGQRVRLPRQGSASGGPGVLAGDLYLTVKVGGPSGGVAPGTHVVLGGEDVEDVDVDAVRNLWPAVRAKVCQISRATDAMLAGATVHAVENGTLILRHNSEPLARRLSAQRNVDVIRDALNSVLGGDWQVRCELSNGQAASTQSRESKAAKMEKVAKLLRKAEAVAGTPEEAVLLDRAFALMSKYGIEEAMVRAAMDDGDSPEADMGTAKVVERIFIVTSKYGSHQILTCLATALHCRGVHWKSEKTGCPIESVRVALFGLPDHIERVHFLWDLLQPQALRALELLPEGASWYAPETVYRRSWVVGFAIGIASRLREHEQKAVEEAENGNAVVLYDLYKRDEERAEAAVRERWPALEAEESCDSFDPLGIAEGQRAAWSAELNRPIRGKAGALVCA